jgi:hypothetical protein
MILTAPFPNDLHGFVAQNVSDVHEDTEYLVEMKVGPQMLVDVTSMMASVGSSTLGAGTVSTRTSRLPCQVTAFIAKPFDRCGRAD